MIIYMLFFCFMNLTWTTEYSWNIFVFMDSRLPSYPHRPNPPPATKSSLVNWRCIARPESLVGFFVVFFVFPFLNSGGIFDLVDMRS